MLGDKERQILESLSLGNFNISDHAATRMDEREVLKFDIQQCGFTARSCVWQPQHETYFVDGMDTENRRLIVAVALDYGHLIVTVIRKEEDER